MAKSKVAHSTKIEAQVRETRGSRKSQFLRAEGKIPAVVYGLGKPTANITLSYKQAESVIHSGVKLVDLEVDGKSEKALVQEVQYDHLQDAIEHVDFLRIDPKQRIHTKVPLEFRGTAKGTKEGGILETMFSELEIEVLATELPEVIRINVENLALHDAIHVKDVVLPPSGKAVANPEQIVCQVRTVKEEVAVAAEPGAAEPEVIGKKPTDEEAAAAAAKPAEKKK